MNIVRALEVALPELPLQTVRKAPPKLDPRVIAKEHLENGQAVVITKLPGSEIVLRLTPMQWTLLQLFDGERSPADVASQFQHETGTAISEEDVQEFAGMLQSQTPLFYRTPIEQNITLQQELRSARKKRSRFHGLDFSDITIKTWHNADRYITWLYPKLRFLFTPVFLWLSIGMFALMGWMWWDRLGEVWSDSFAFYNFTQKSGSDLIEFWFLFGAMAAIHETAHGLVGKHFGATIEKMGFTLMYFAPSFFCDATQVWILGGKWARIATSFAGIWLDLIVCFFATAIWWSTPAGMPVHDWAYKIMMVTGIGVSVLNLNPLIKLDGYLIFSELVAEPSLKESSTAYLSAWVRRHIFRLPGEVPYVVRRKRAFYVVYAILSELYSWGLLSFLMVVTYHILRSFTPEWAFIPALGIGVWVFQSRIKTVVDLMKFLYLDKKQRVRAWFTPLRTGILSAFAVMLLLLPVWPDFVQGRFVLAPRQSAMIRATVPGVVSEIFVHEGQIVTSGATLASVRNLKLQSQAADAHAQLVRASAEETRAALSYGDMAGAQLEQAQRAEQHRIVADQLNQLTIVTPFNGVVLTSHPENLLERSVAEGDLLLELADTSRLEARIYLPEYAMHEIRMGQPVRMLVAGRLTPLSGILARVSAAAVAMPPEMASKVELQGITPPVFYLGSADATNDGGLIPGMTGLAKVQVGRRSLAGFASRFAGELLERRLW